METSPEDMPISYTEKGRLYLSLCRKARLFQQQENERNSYVLLTKSAEEMGEVAIRLLERQRQLFRDYTQVDADDMKYLFELAPAALHLFLERTQLLPELFLHGHCLYVTGDGMPASPYSEYGFESMGDALTKLKSLAAAWKDELSIEIFPIAARNKVMVEITAKN